MSTRKTTKGITIKSKFVFSSLNEIILVASFCMPLLVELSHRTTKINPGDLYLGLTSIVILVLIYFCSHIKILITRSEMIYKPASIFEKTMQTHLNNISKVVLTNDKFLVIYNNEGEQDNALNLKKFKRDDIQVLLNILNQKAQVEIELEILSQEGYMINSQMSSQQPSNIRRRVVNNEIQTKNNMEGRGTVSNHNLEFKKQDKDVEAHSNRRLEL